MILKSVAEILALSLEKMKQGLSIACVRAWAQQPFGNFFQGTVSLIVIERFHLMSWQPCWCILNKRILIFSFVLGPNIATMPIDFCFSRDV